jgi:hypothetical protein
MWLVCDSRDNCTISLPVISSQDQALVDHFATLTQYNISGAFVSIGLSVEKFVRRTSRNVFPSPSARRGGHCGYAVAFWLAAASIVWHFVMPPACHLLPAFIVLAVTTMTNIITVLFA